MGRLMGIEWMIGEGFLVRLFEGYWSFEAGSGSRS